MHGVAHESVQLRVVEVVLRNRTRELALAKVTALKPAKPCKSMPKHALNLSGMQTRAFALAGVRKRTLTWRVRVHCANPPLGYEACQEWLQLLCRCTQKRAQARKSMRFRCRPRERVRRCMLLFGKLVTCIMLHQSACSFVICQVITCAFLQLRYDLVRGPIAQLCTTCWSLARTAHQGTPNAITTHACCSAIACKCMRWRAKACFRTTMHKALCV
jgi:hypothetical protein